MEENTSREGNGRENILIVRGDRKGKKKKIYEVHNIIWDLRYEVIAVLEEIYLHLN
jgi:hypothetical protein